MNDQRVKVDEKLERFLSDENLQISKLIGRGSFSSVYAVKHLLSGKKFALKSLLRTACPDQAAKELQILHQIGGQCNVIKLFAASRIEDRVLFLLEYVPFDQFSKVVKVMSRSEVKHYMFNLLSALSYIHKKGVVHCDLKPSNFLYNRKNKRYALIDFGLSVMVNKDDISRRSSGKTADTQNCACQEGCVCSYCLKKPKFVINKTGTLGYRPPEVIMDGKRLASPTNDIWAAGVMFLCMLSKRHPFWYPEDDMDALMQIMCVMGTEAVMRMAEKIGYRLELSSNFPSLNLAKLCIFLETDPTSWPPAGHRNCNYCSAALSELRLPNDYCFCLKQIPGLQESSSRFWAFSLLYGLLNIHPEERWTAEHALQCDYFVQQRNSSKEISLDIENES